MGRTNRRREQRANAQRRSGTAPVTGTPPAGGRPPRATLPPLSRRPKPAWRETLDQWGGLPVLGVLLVLVVGVVFFAVQAWPTAPSTGELMGEAVQIGPADHIAAAAQLQIPEGQPPAGGPHFVQPLRAGIYGAPLEDGNAIHSLEHGMVWITYRADLLSPKDLEALTDVARDHASDVLLSPRPANTNSADIVSWGQRMKLDTPIDKATVERFIETNRNRSPEPGVR